MPHSKIIDILRHFNSKSKGNITIEEAEEVTEDSVNSSNNNQITEEKSEGQEVLLSPAMLISPSDLTNTHYTRKYLDISDPHYLDTSGLSSPCDSRHDSIVELYCDDEFKIGFEFENTHLNLTHSDPYDGISLGLVHDILEDNNDENEEDIVGDEVFLPFSVPSLLQESLKDDHSIEWSRDVEQAGVSPSHQLSDYLQLHDRGNVEETHDTNMTHC